MRAVFGVVSLLIALAVVGILAARQMRAVNASVGSAIAPASAPTQPAGNVREQSQHLQQRVTSDVAKALEQGAARSEQADK